MIRDVFSIHHIPGKTQHVISSSSQSPLLSIIRDHHCSYTYVPRPFLWGRKNQPGIVCLLMHMIFCKNSKTIHVQQMRYPKKYTDYILVVVYLSLIAHLEREWSMVSQCFVQGLPVLGASIILRLSGFSRSLSFTYDLAASPLY